MPWLSFSLSGLCTCTVSACCLDGDGKLDGICVGACGVAVSGDLGELNADVSSVPLGAMLFAKGTSCISSGNGWWAPFESIYAAR